MRLSKLFCVALILVIFSTISAYSMPFVSFGAVGGLSTPNDKINLVYNKEIDQDLGKFVNDGMENGYHIAARGRLKLNDNFAFVGGIGWHSFPESSLEIRDPETNELMTTLSTKTNIVPISAGINVYPINTIFAIYGVGELTYNHISNSVDVKYGGVDFPYSQSPSDSRFGFGFGAGADLKVLLLKLNVEAKYNYTNLIGKEGDEENKSYFSLSVGVFF